MKDCVVFDASCDDVGSGLNHSAEYRQIVGFSPPTGENNVLAAGTNQLCDTLARLIYCFSRFPAPGMARRRVPAARGEPRDHRADNIIEQRGRSVGVQVDRTLRAIKLKERAHRMVLTLSKLSNGQEYAAYGILPKSSNFLR
jgi:hypothetical protein